MDSAIPDRPACDEEADEGRHDLGGVKLSLSQFREMNPAPFKCLPGQRFRIAYRPDYVGSPFYKYRQHIMETDLPGAKS